jgi:transcriptional regulator with XRE-family HTH domain
MFRLNRRQPSHARGNRQVSRVREFPRDAALTTRGPPVNPTTPRANRRAFAHYLRTAMTTKYGQRAKATQLARDTGLSDQTISRWLNEGADPTPEKLRQLAPVLDVPLAELLAVAEIVPADELPNTANLDLALWAALINQELDKRSIGPAELAKLLDRHTLTPRVVTAWTEAKAGASPDDAIRVAQALGLPATRVLRHAGHDTLADYIDEVAGADATDSAALEPLIARVRDITRGLTEQQRRTLEEDLLRQVGDWYLLAEAKAAQLRNDTDPDSARGAS